MPRRGPFRTAIAAIATLALAAPPAAAQSSPWNWGWPVAGPSAEEWSPEAFADFLGSGQAPHPAVVRIVAPENGGTAMGSGVLVDVNATQGLVLTNWHVIRGSRSMVLVQFPDGFQSAGRVIRHDEPWDLAAVAIWRPRVAPVPIASAPPVVGEPLSIAGYGKGPYRSEAGPCTQYLAPGAGYPLEFVELQASARQGDSGGPILNARGELAGILFGRADGRTIGACSTRVRTFLAAVGSDGITPEESRAIGTPATNVAPPAALEREPGPPAPLAPPPAAVETPLRGGDPPALPPEPTESVSAAAPAAVGPPPGEWAGTRAPQAAPSLREFADPRTGGQAVLTGVGGALLALAGLRTVLGGRSGPRGGVRGGHEYEGV